jgi:hypothetical protein
VTLTAYGLASGYSAPSMYYTVCTSSVANNCYLDSASAEGKSSSMIALGSLDSTKSIRTGTINHNPSVCYMITVYYPNSNGPIKNAFKISHTTAGSQSITSTSTMTDIIEQNSYQYY